MSSLKPTAVYRRAAGTLTLKLSSGSGNLDRAFFGYVVASLKDYAWHLTGGSEPDRADAELVEALADAIKRTLARGAAREDGIINAIFGGP